MPKTLAPRLAPGTGLAGGPEALAPAPAAATVTGTAAQTTGLPATRMRPLPPGGRFSGGTRPAAERPTG